MSAHPALTVTGCAALRVVEQAPEGTLFPREWVLSALGTVGEAAPSDAPSERSDSTPTAQSWREKLWKVPPETRLGVAEVAEAFGWSRSSVYKRTSAKSGVERLPHRKLDGQLVFLAGQLRSWISDRETVVIEPPPCGASLAKSPGRVG